jgi:hypothetical protein
MDGLAGTKKLEGGLFPNRFSTRTTSDTKKLEGGLLPNRFSTRTTSGTMNSWRRSRS